MTDGNFADEMQEIVEDFLNEANENLSDLETVFVDLEKDPQNLDLLNSIFRTVHSLKGAADFLGFTRLVKVAHQSESLLNQLRKGNMTLTPEMMDVIFEAVDLIKVLLRQIETGDTSEIEIDGTVEKLTDLLSQGQGKTANASTPAAEKVTREEAAEASQTEAKAAPRKTTSKKDKKTKKHKEEEQNQGTDEVTQDEESTVATSTASCPPPAIVTPEPEARASLSDSVPEEQQKAVPEAAIEQTIRVDVERLDQVMNLVGELVLARNRLFQINQGLELRYGDIEEIQSLLDNSLHLSLLTTDLQLAVLKTRMQPMRKVFSKIPRMARDLARKTKKEVSLEIIGEETEVDKSIIEAIGDPLVHLIRNSVDHGIEIPDFREPLGKPQKGLLRVSAFYEGDHIIIEIQDDGKGIDPEKLRQVAVEKGVLDPSEAERLSEKECLNLIFKPGFSTAERVTNTSGRGVGMDVVNSNIAKLNGTISLDSEVGKGTRLRIRLPLTVAIIQALMVGVGEEIFAIPLSSIIETLRINQSDIRTVDGSEVISLREEILPVIQLSEALEIPLPELDGDVKMHVVIAGVAEKKVGLMVTQLLGQEEIVIKPLGQYLKGRQEFTGATLTGGGKVIMILDIGGLVGQGVMA